MTESFFLIYLGQLEVTEERLHRHHQPGVLSILSSSTSETPKRFRICKVVDLNVPTEGSSESFDIPAWFEFSVNKSINMYNYKQRI